MFGIGEGELLIIVVFAFLLFGPDKLPQMGRTIGRALRQFRETQEKMTSVVQAEVIDPMTAAAQAPLKPKKAGASAAADDEDADIATEKAAEARKETFAERRARLAAEKAAKEAEAEGTSGETASAAPSDDKAAAATATAATAPASASADDASKAADASAANQDEPAADPVRTTEDLYARRPRKHHAVEAEEAAADNAAEAADASTGAAPEAGANADAPKTAPDAPAVEGGER
ncbi:twin-arginine translocase TatA/TatE family subunit [Collinsella sp. An2]|uniref:Sec-independent protein translocase subunit TatA/TatB n=1 Tax=Collinsella sp. An2 TaxID=1965585 RepID=UPI000B373830|nr:twin-arginine translocase TatA/TatE family subunit [Collinsella sp. An2]OUP09511.1 hypothetical protein B5F33_04945 [Collinsella sp. An2]